MSLELARNGRTDWSRSCPLSGAYLPRRFIAVEAEIDLQRPRTFDSAGNLAHLEISCSKRRRLPNGSVVYITFAP
jgi:hypothetical protein